MRLVIQRVAKASVRDVKADKVVGKIDKGLFVLLGVKRGDKKETAQKMAAKLSKLRLMADSNEKMNHSVLDTKDKVLIVSQFSLYSNNKDGNRPSFVEVEETKKAKEVYDTFITALEDCGVGVEKGSFGNYMQIDLTLDGPVTIIYEE